MKSLQEHLNESLANEARMVDVIWWGITSRGRYPTDVTAYLTDKKDNRIKFDEKEMNKIIKNGNASRSDEDVIEQIFKAFPEAQYIRFSYFDAYGDEDKHECGYWDKDNMEKGMYNQY